MKLNPKVYKQLTGEPFDTQNANGKIIEFHYMNNTPFLFQFASRGRFAIWTSDGNNYRVLIEAKYYEALKDFYQPEVNLIWLSFLEKVGALSKKINMWFIIPTFFLYIIVAGVATIMFPNQTLPILLGMIVLVVLSNMVQGRLVNRRVREENKLAQDKIREFLGNERFDGLVKSQDDHYQEYFKFNEEPVIEQEEVIEEEKTNEDNSEDKNGTESN